MKDFLTRRTNESRSSFQNRVVWVYVTDFLCANFCIDIKAEDKRGRTQGVAYKVENENRVPSKHRFKYVKGAKRAENEVDAVSE